MYDFVKQSLRIVLDRKNNFENLRDVPDCGATEQIGGSQRGVFRARTRFEAEQLQESVQRGIRHSAQEGLPRSRRRS